MINYQNKCRLIRGWDDLFNKLKENINQVCNIGNPLLVYVVPNLKNPHLKSFCPGAVKTSQNLVLRHFKKPVF